MSGKPVDEVRQQRDNDAANGLIHIVVGVSIWLWNSEHPGGINREKARLDLRHYGLALNLGFKRPLSD